MATRITPELVETSGNRISELGAQYLEKITEMYNKIDVDLNQYWSGDTYNAFKQSFSSYREDLESLGILLRDNYRDTLHTIASKFSSTAESLISMASQSRKIGG